jgi:hypothetical protein
MGVGFFLSPSRVRSEKTPKKQGRKMSDWTSGYVADIGYTYGYYTELNPLRTNKRTPTLFDFVASLS